MELLQLYYFKHVAELEHVSKAAEQLHVAQPALSQAIRRLEQEFQTTFFDRVGKNVVLNEKGKILLKYANQIFCSIEKAQREIGDAREQELKTLTLSIQSASLFLPELLSEFRLRHPDAVFEVIQNADKEKSKGADVTIYSSLEKPTDDHHCILMYEPLVVILPRGHRLEQKSSVSLEELKEEPFINLQQGSNLYGIVEHCFKEAGFTPHVSLYCDNPGTLRELVNKNFGVALLPEITQNCRHNPAIVAKKLEGKPYGRYIVLSWNPDKYKSRLVEDFCRVTEAFFKNL